MQRYSFSKEYILKLCLNVWGIQRSESRWTPTRMCYQTCKKKLPISSSNFLNNVCNFKKVSLCPICVTNHKFHLFLNNLPLNLTSVKTFINPSISRNGGTVWESNPADLTRRSQAVLKLEGCYLSWFHLVVSKSIKS